MNSVFDREILSEYVDGQLDDDARVSVAVHLSENPEEATIVEQYRSQDDRLRLVADAVLHEPIPKRLLEIVRAKPSEENIEHLDIRPNRGPLRP